MRLEFVIERLPLKVAANLLDLSMFSKQFIMPAAKFRERNSSARSVWIAFIESVMTLKRRSRARRGRSTVLLSGT